MNERIELDTISFSYSVGARVADEYSAGTVKDRRSLHSNATKRRRPMRCGVSCAVVAQRPATGRG